MSRIGLFYGSTDGHTADIAARLKKKLDALLAPEGEEAVELFDVAEYYLEEMLDFPYLILGAPTWNQGQMQRDWEHVMDEFAALDLSGKRAAAFGLGDQVGYPKTFADALFFVADQVRGAGAQLVGAWPLDGYDFDSSWAVENGQFLGLVLDEDNQPEETEGRMDAWIIQILREFDVRDQESASGLAE